MWIACCTRRAASTAVSSSSTHAVVSPAVRGQIATFISPLRILAIHFAILALYAVRSPGRLVHAPVQPSLHFIFSAPPVPFFRALAHAARFADLHCVRPPHREHTRTSESIASRARFPWPVTGSVLHPSSPRHRLCQSDARASFLPLRLPRHFCGRYCLSRKTKVGQ